MPRSEENFRANLPEFGAMSSTRPPVCADPSAGVTKFRLSSEKLSLHHVHARSHNGHDHSHHAEHNSHVPEDSPA